MTVTHLHATSTAGPTVVEAVERFLARDRFEDSTRAAYAKTLRILVEATGQETSVAAVTPETVEEVLARWDGASPTTYNRHRAALASLFGWALRRGWAHQNPVELIEARKLRRRSEHERRQRPITRDQLARLWRLDGVPGRDRLLWRMAYETWARADELLGMDIADLDLGRREGRVRGKGGDIETVWWSTGTARLLPRVIADRRRGPLFLASRRPRQPMPTADVDPDTGRARLSYRQAERRFAEAGTRIDPDGVAWTLHRLRHAGISHAVEEGANLAQVRAKSRHASLRSLEVYANPGADACRALTDGLDSEARRI